jgi:hypothetical protein
MGLVLATAAVAGFGALVDGVVCRRWAFSDAAAFQQYWAFGTSLLVCSLYFSDGGCEFCRFALFIPLLLL